MPQPETLPPPSVTAEYLPDHYRAGSVTIELGACAAMLRGFGIDDKHIASTNIVVNGNRSIELAADPDSSDVYDYYVFSASRSIRRDSSGYVALNLGSVRDARDALLDKQPFGSDQSDVERKEHIERLESALLIPGLSQRADLVLMGESGLNAERLAAMRQVRKKTAAKSIGTNILRAASGVTVGVAAEAHHIIPTWTAWVMGAVIVGGSAIWTKLSAEEGYNRTLKRYYTRKQWPDQVRARQRLQEYSDNPNSPILLRLPDES